MLIGLNKAWFMIFSNEMYQCNHILCNRTHRGILVEDDEEAIRYQISYYRASRAKLSLTGNRIISSCKNGIDNTNEENQKWNNSDRNKLIRAKKIFKERYLEKYLDEY